jgi:probable rRNA maturation factor
MSAVGDKEENFIITKKVKTSPAIAGLPFDDMKNAVLGKRYELSLVLTGNGLSKKLNSIYRGKNRPTNVLSFPLSKKVGEIFIDLHLAKRESALHNQRVENYVGKLFIHGLLHLKGMAHGGRMEHEEEKLVKRFNI